VLTILIDQLTKALIVRASIFRVTLIPGFLWLEKVTNTGIAFGMFSSYTDQITVISIVVVIVLAIYQKRFRGIQRVAVGMIIGGALGNIVDRIRFGKVVDFIRLRYYPAIFNVADSLIFIGGVIIALTYLWGVKCEAEGHGKGKGMETGQVSPRKTAQLDIPIDDPESYKGWQGVCGWLDQKAQLQGKGWRNDQSESP
jgi:signal peptidase II